MYIKYVHTINYLIIQDLSNSFLLVNQHKYSYINKQYKKYLIINI